MIEESLQPPRWAIPRCHGAPAPCVLFPVAGKAFSARSLFAVPRPAWSADRLQLQLRLVPAIARFAQTDSSIVAATSSCLCKRSLLCESTMARKAFSHRTDEGTCTRADRLPARHPELRSDCRA